MTKQLEEAVRELRALPEDQQDRAAEVLSAFVHTLSDDDGDVDRV